jgi:hypothetical protein
MAILSWWRLERRTRSHDEAIKEPEAGMQQ